MRWVSPAALSCIHRIVSRDSKHHLFVTLVYCAPFDRPREPVSSSETWRLAATDLGRDGVLDHWAPKAQAEVIVSGACFARPRAETSSVRLRVASAGRELIDKRLTVFGDRRWTPIGASAPEPFVSIPIDYRHAFGGPGYAANPIGRGFAPSRVEGEPVFLPNVEDARHFVLGPGDEAPPATLAGRDPTSARLDKRASLNLAPPDQRVRGFFEGTEELRIENMHPEKGVLEMRLPGFRARCFVRRARGAERAAGLSEIRLHLDTLRLFPHRERAMVFFRGELEVSADSAPEIDTLLAALDDCDEGARALAHYEAVLASVGHTTSSSVLVPGGALMPPSVASREPSAAGAPPPEGAAEADGILRAARAEIEALTARLVASGVDAELIPSLAPLAPPPLGAVDASTVKASARKEHAERMRGLAELARAGSDAPSSLGAGAPSGVGPPTFSADAEIERLESILRSGAQAGIRLASLEQRLADPGFRASLVDVERTLRRHYRLVAHLVAPSEGGAKARPGRLKDERRALALEARKGRRDFTGVDLSGEDLSGLDLEGAFFEGASLRRANLSRANLRNAVLARATLDGANLDGARLDGANLGSISAKGASFRGASLRGAVLYHAGLERADLRSAVLVGASVSEVDLSSANLTGALGERLVFRRAKLEHASLRGARFARVVFIECALDSVDASGSDLSSVVLARCTAERAVFRDVVADDLHVEGASFREADLAGAVLPRASLRGVSLERARLRGANLRRSDLSGASLGGADLTHAILTECVAVDADLSGATLSGANLMLAVLHRANLRGADLSETNLASADLTGATGDDHTSLAGSNARRAIVDLPSPRARYE